MSEPIMTIHEELLEDYFRGVSDAEFSAAAEPDWKKIQDMGSRLWLDTGAIERANQQWTSEFSGLTTNNALLNHEVQKGEYDGIVKRAAEQFRNCGLSRKEIILEIAFLLNALHGRRLAKRFDCQVSVELHTDLARDVEGSVEYGCRYHEIEPDRFVIKVPFTAEGVIAARRLSNQGIPVNQTVSFSVRQNFVISRLSRARFGNVFLGRINGLFEQNDLPSVKRLGEKVTLASDKLLKFLRVKKEEHTHLIAASIRSGDQVMNLGGVDVLTIPPEVAEEYLELIEENQTTGRLRLHKVLDEAQEAPGTLLSNLITVDDTIRELDDELLDIPIGDLHPDELRERFVDGGVSDLFPDWNPEQIKRIKAQGKIPDLSQWQDELQNGDVALDSLMALAGLHSFIDSQKKMDERIEGLI